MSDGIVQQRRRPDPVGAGWLPYGTVARCYLHVAPELVRGGIERGELEAHETPRAGRGGGRPSGRLYVSLADVDAWVRAYWPAYEPKGAMLHA